MNYDNEYVTDLPIDDYSNTITTGDAYSKRLEELDDTQSATTHYNDSGLKKRVAQSLLIGSELTDAQFEVLVSFIIAIIEIEQACNCELKNISVTTSVEDEIIFYRKSSLGVSILSIDLEGDILYNFTGYKIGFDTERYPYKTEIDFERLIYNFLAIR